MDITILTMPTDTDLMLTCETPKCTVEICNFNNLIFQSK